MSEEAKRGSQYPFLARRSEPLAAGISARSEYLSCERISLEVVHRANHLDQESF
jgi:hypothetical protein